MTLQTNLKCQKLSGMGTNLATMDIMKFEVFLKTAGSKSVWKRLNQLTRSSNLAFEETLSFFTVCQKNRKTKNFMKNILEQNRGSYSRSFKDVIADQSVKTI